MTFIFCLDDKNGLLFAGKRQSKDRILRERMLSKTDGQILWMSPYSASQFEENGVYRAADDFLSQAGDNDYCFLESDTIPLEKADKLIVYRWNRHYPATSFLKSDLAKEGFKLTSSAEFAGSSHEKITEDIFER